MRERRGRIPSAEALTTLVVVVAVLVFYYWTAAAPGLTFGHWPDAYNSLSTGFLHGHLSLDRLPPPELAAQRPPYVATQYGPYLDSDTRDLALYEGRFYSTWGPSAALPFLLAHVLGLGDLPPSLGIMLLVSAGFLLLVVLLWALLRRVVPKRPWWLLPVATLALGLGSGALYLIRIPEPYEVAIAGGYAFAAAGLLALYIGLARARWRLLFLAFGSCAFGLALAARADLLPLGLLPCVLLFVLWRRTRSKRERRRLALALVGPFGGCVALLAAYNAARFGSPTELGYTYQLTVGVEPGLARSGLGNVLPGLWYYLVAPPVWRLQFPYAWPVPPPYFTGPTPAVYGPVEKVAGMLPLAPVLLMLPLAAGSRRARALWSRDVRIGLAALVGAAAAILLVVAYSFSSATMRYAVDFAPIFLLASLLAWATLWAAGRRRRLVSVAGIVFVLYGALVGMSFSIIGNRGQLARESPETFARLERFFSPLPTLAAAVRGHPMVAAVNRDPTLRPWGYDHLSLDGVRFPLAGVTTVQVASGARGRFVLLLDVLRETDEPGLLLGVSANGHGLYVPLRSASEQIPVVLDRGINDVKLDIAKADRVAVTAASPIAHLRLRGVR